MTQDKDSKDKPHDLGRRAEAVLHVNSSDARDISALSGDEVQQLIHELQVHQIELEMQNEELRRSQAEVERSKDRYADLYDYAPIGYVTLDKNSLVLESNFSAAGLLGTERGSRFGGPATLRRQ